MKFSWMKSITNRSIIGISIADELWYDVLKNDDKRTHWFSITSSHQENDPDVKVYSLTILYFLFRFGYNFTVEVTK